MYNYRPLSYQDQSDEIWDCSLPSLLFGGEGRECKVCITPLGDGKVLYVCTMIAWELIWWVPNLLRCYDCVY